jgi:alkanesulfonate monooxygenase SsuD/methylene tetrahydromethanopterin reductase-like flavin-dependent oxidoreductase (luciferase family)
MREKWAAGDRRGASEAVPDEVVDDLVIHGDLETCRHRVDAYRAAGLDTPVIAVIPPPGIDVAEAVRGLAPPA